jgi:hypothetical protein
MVELLKQLSTQELEEMLNAQAELERRLILYGPQTDDELHAWIKAELHFDIPRVAVCEGHDPPFVFLADLYFERIDAGLGVANRGGAKTLMVAILHWLNSKFKPGTESCTFGATEAQSLRCYAHLKGWIYDSEGERRPEIVSSLMRETLWKTGSRVEVLPGTPSAVNGPHPQKAHADEIELMDDGTWRESRNMTVSRILADGRLVRPQDIATSTRKGPNGRVQELIDEITRAIKEGYKPPRKLYIWCIKETAAEQPNCRMTNVFRRQARLRELGRNPLEICQCHLVRKGEWDDGTPRVLSDVCKGDFFRSRGWQPHVELAKQFKENDRETFECQQLCAKPEMRHHYMPTFSEQRNGLRNYVPDPNNGPIFQSVDWGGTNPHAVNWYQLLRYEIEVTTFLQERKRLREGSLVCFDEIYKAEIGNSALGELVKAREDYWRRIFPLFRVFERFADPQGKSARMDWKEIHLYTKWHTTREFDEHIKAIKEFIDDDLFFVDVIRCPMFCKEGLAWRRDPQTGKQIDEFNHCMSDFRYAVANIKKIKRRALRSGTRPMATSIPRNAQVTVVRPPSGPIGYRGREESEFDNWRKSLGGPLVRER